MGQQRVVCGDDQEERYWVVERLWGLAARLPVVEVPLQEFAAHFDSRCWFGPDGLTVREFGEMVRAILDADLAYPVILAAEGWIMDGRKRLWKAMIEGRDKIAVVRFDTTPEPDERVPRRADRQDYP
ncbi:MAG: hypothetical protein HYU66_09465 [Armatimonadetes bacterium]|nr:hypothetical protein [Armatimonadota bacterium]